MPTNHALDNLREQIKLHQDENRDAVALELSNMYLSFRPDDREVLLIYAQCLRVVGRKTEAEEIYLELLSTGDARPWHQLHAELAMVYHDWGKYELSEKHWKESCCARNPPGWAWIMRGANLACCERFDEAIECQQKGSLIHGKNCSPEEGFLNLGKVLRAQGKYSDAIDALQNAITLEPDYPEAIEDLASLENWSECIQQAKNLLGE